MPNLKWASMEINDMHKIHVDAKAGPAIKCIVCGCNDTVYCTKCKTLVCKGCHKPTTQIYCELCLEKLPKHKTHCEKKMELSYKKHSNLV